jgi:anti-sigma B factor antagonist
VIVEKQRLAGATLLKLEGVIKFGESAQFLAQTLERVLAEAESEPVLLEFSAVNTIDSTGIGELVGYLGRFQAVGRRLVLVNPSDRVRRLLQVAGLDSLFSIHDSVDDALGASRGRPRGRES